MQPERLKSEPLANLPRPDALKSTTQFAGNIPSNAAPIIQPDRPTADQAPQQLGNLARQPNAAAAQIERPQAARQADTTALTPSVSGPRRMQVETPASQPSKMASPETLAGQLTSDPSRLQKLAQVPLSSLPNNILADQQDQLKQSKNNTVAKKQSTVPPQTVTPDVGPNTDGGGATASTSPAAGQNAGSQTAQRRRGDGQQLPSVYQSRNAESRQQAIARNGGTARSEAAVQRALHWLAAHQSADGRWDASLYSGGNETGVMGHNRKGAGAKADTAVTGLALLALMANGHTHLEGQYQKQVRRGLEFLMRTQATNGSLAGNSNMFAQMYCHGMASLALSEAYALTGDRRLAPYVQRAVNYTLYAQHPAGGWRYRPGDEGDMSQFGWQVMALKSAELGGIAIDQKSWDAMRYFLGQTAAGTNRGLSSYRPGEKATRTMTAESQTCRYFLNVQQTSLQLREAGNFLAQEMPGTAKPNLYYWYYGTLAMYLSKSEHWDQWNQAMQQQLIRRQRTTGDWAGSWDPDTTWGGYGGRVYSTAMATLCLEVYYRYLPVFGQRISARR